MDYSHIYEDEYFAYFRSSRSPETVLTLMLFLELTTVPSKEFFLTVPFTEIGKSLLTSPEVEVKERWNSDPSGSFIFESPEVVSILTPCQITISYNKQLLFIILNLFFIFRG